MKNKEQIDELILKALNEEEAAFYQDLDEPSIPEMVGGLFQGKMKWIIMLTVPVMLILGGLTVYCLIEFLNTQSTGLMIKWGAGLFFCLMAISMLKIFYWMEINKNATMREMKRLELQVAVLADKVSNKS